MKLYYSPGACSIGIHVILNEIGAPFEAQRLDLKGGEHLQPAFQAINPKGKVPTLERDGGRVLTEYPVIAHHLAASHPDAGLWPADAESGLVAASTMDFCVATVHMQGFSRLFRPGNFAPHEVDHEAVKARGRQIVDKSFGILAHELGGQEYVAGGYSVADTALFYVEWWGAVRMGMTLPEPLAGHLARMLARPAVQKTLAAEGFA